MPAKEQHGASDHLFVFGLYFLSMILVLGYVFWLTPEFVATSFFIWLIFTVALIYFSRQQGVWSRYIVIMKKQWHLFPFLFFTGLSIFWSIRSDVSLYRWLILICTILAGGYIGLKYNLKEIVNLLSIFGACILLLSFIVVIFAPNIGVMNYYSIQGAWKGVFWHKNHMGLISTFINILFLIKILDLWRSKDTTMLLWAVFYVCSLFFLYQTDSVAAYMTTIFLHGVVLILLLWLMFRERLHWFHYLIFFVFIILASLFLYLNVDHLFAMFNRNTSLTGRIPMWTYLFNAYVDKKPLFGYGFNAFWYDSFHRVDVQKVAGYPGPIIISDNGFIDLIVNTGYVGLSLFLIFYFSAWWRSVWYAVKTNEINGFFPLIMLIYTLLANISWSVLFENEGFFMLNIVAIVFCISKGISIDNSDLSDN